jgi:hypothetical protein
MSRTFKAGVLAVVEWVFLLALWIAFVSQWKKDELLIGMAVAAIGAIADAVVKAKGVAKFSPKFNWLALIFWEPWYVAQGTWVTLKAFALALFGKAPDSGFQTLRYESVRGNARASAQRALAIGYLTIPPNSIVVGIDTTQRQVLTHQLLPTPNSLMAEKLGVKA